ncbi:MAG: hypothetical protein HC930_16155 [Hydrococcus sp. SU_1_0]|nr:hypothetical protein [Hydrococcus sp. SU_1_0]
MLEAEVEKLQLNIEFIENHQPSLESGEYKVTVEQSVKIKVSHSLENLLKLKLI